MSKIAEPEIVFCEYNHIYDKSLSAACPYCKQIAEKTDQMKNQIDTSGKKSGNRFWGFGRQNRDRDQDGNVTTLLSRKWGFGGKNQNDDDDDATVLSSRRSDDDDDDATVLSSRNTAAEDDDATVLSARPAAAKDDDATALVTGARQSDASAREAMPIPERDVLPLPQIRTIPIIREPAPSVPEEAPAPAAEAPAAARPVPAAPRRKVIGWLVCTVSQWDCGSSLELREGDNHIAFDADGRLACLEEDDSAHTTEAVIYRDRITGIFQIRAAGTAAVTINDQALAGCTYMQPYSRIEFSQASVVFFPAVGVCGFEWRQ